MAKKKRKSPTRKSAPSHHEAKLAAKKLMRYGSFHAKKGATAAAKATKSAAKKMGSWISDIAKKAKKSI